MSVLEIPVHMPWCKVEVISSHTRGGYMVLQKELGLVDVNLTQMSHFGAQ